MTSPPRLDGWTIRRAPLPRGVQGDICWPTRTITVDPRLPPAVQRCAIAHETEHAHRGPLPADPVLAAKEEDLVERAAARRLIKLHPLGEAMAESDDLRHVAHLLDVDPALLRARLAHLHPAETAHLRRRLDG